MKLKGLLVGVITVAIVAIMSTSSFAAIYLTCKVNRTATTANGVASIMLADTATNPAWVGNVWFVAPVGSDDPALATALTAISLGQNVRIGLTNAASRTLLQIGVDAAQ